MSTIHVCGRYIVLFDNATLPATVTNGMEYIRESDLRKRQAEEAAKEAELTTLRQRAEAAEASRDTARGVANAFRDTIERATGNHDAVHGLMILCESHEKLQAAERRVAELEAFAKVHAWARATIRQRWSFDNNQQHTHSWHDREDFFAEWNRRHDEAKAAIDAAGGQQ